MMLKRPSPAVMWAAGKVASATGIVASFAVNIPAAYLATTQAASARDDKEAAERSAMRAEVMLVEARRLADAQEASLAATRQIAAAANSSASESRRLANSAALGADAAQASAQVGHRQLTAYVSESEANERRSFEQNRPRLVINRYLWNDVEVGSMPSVELDVENLGRSPPRALRMWSKMYFAGRTEAVSNGPSCSALENSTKQTLQIGRSGKFTSTRLTALAASEQKFLTSPNLAMILAGKLCYKDDAGRFHATTFCGAYYEGSPHACDIGDDPD